VNCPECNTWNPEDKEVCWQRSLLALSAENAQAGGKEKEDTPNVGRPTCVDVGRADPILRSHQHRPMLSHRRWRRDPSWVANEQITSRAGCNRPAPSPLA